MKNAAIYSANGNIVYQYGNSRTVVQKGSIPMFEVFKDGQWVPGRNRHALNTIEKVKAILGK